ncbi:MAG: YbbR-like domain-containing protein, partial [Prevotella sp.]|nr:YbbR-like domain-containing protein [Prevotella sp.]
MNKEFLIFLSFLLLSGAFWLMMAMNDTYEREVKIPVYLDKIPKKVVVTSNTEDTLRVTLRDRGFSLAPYIYGGMMPIAINFGTYDKGSGKGTVTSSELQKLIYQNIFKSTKIVSLKPDRLDYSYNYGESKKVGLRLQGTIVPSQSYYIAKVKFNPEQVTVYSQKKKLDSIRYIFTEKMDLRNLSDTIIKTVKLAKINGVKCVPA